jgi:hypothetical protein
VGGQLQDGLERAWVAATERGLAHFASFIRPICIVSRCINFWGTGVGSLEPSNANIRMRFAGRIIGFSRRTLRPQVHLVDR